MRHIRQQGGARTRPLSGHETSAQDFLLCPGPDRGRTNLPEISCRSSGEVRVQTPCCPYSPRPSSLPGQTGVIRPLTFQGSGTMQICACLTSAAYLREHNCESVLRTRQIVPGTAWVVEVLQVTNRYAREGSKSAVRRLHTVRRTKLKSVRSLRNLHLSSSFCGSRP